MLGAAKRRGSTPSSGQVALRVLVTTVGMLAIAIPVAAIALTLHLIHGSQTASFEGPGAPPASQADNWATYSSDKWGYSLKYPAGWHNLQNFGAPDSHKYFSSEDVPTPLMMSPRGVWLTVATKPLSATDCSRQNILGRRIRSIGSVPLSGSQGTRYVTDPQGGAREDGWTVTFNLARRGLCFEFVVVSLEQATRDTNLPLADAILSTVQFR